MRFLFSVKKSCLRDQQVARRRSSVFSSRGMYSFLPSVLLMGSVSIFSLSLLKSPAQGALSERTPSARLILKDGQTAVADGPRAGMKTESREDLSLLPDSDLKEDLKQFLAISPFGKEKALGQVSWKLRQDGDPSIGFEGPPSGGSTVAERSVARSHDGSFAFFSFDPALQEKVQNEIQRVNAPHVIALAMNPQTGRILALAERSSLGKHLFSHAGFPAASLFKILTTATALELGVMEPGSELRFRGGTYTLNKWNYFPDPRKDVRRMSLTEALARSCNPAFARVAMNFEPQQLRQRVNSAWFNRPIPFDTELSSSHARVPTEDYEYTRTAAGFGEVFVSPVHAALIMSAVASGGLLPRPRMLDEIVSKEGKTLYRAEPEWLGRVIEPETAEDLMEMMVETTTIGTSRRAFGPSVKASLGGNRVAGKTGTLSGKNPDGVNNWFVGAAPVKDPEIVVASLVVYPGYISTKSSLIARRIFEDYFELKSEGKLSQLS